MVLGWISVALAGAVPFYLSGLMSPIDAFFEAMAGFTTTGVQTPEDIAPSLLLWREHVPVGWGIGTVVLFVAVGPLERVTNSDDGSSSMPTCRRRTRTRPMLVIRNGTYAFPQTVARYYFLHEVQASSRRPGPLAGWWRRWSSASGWCVCARPVHALVSACYVNRIKIRYGAQNRAVPVAKNFSEILPAHNPPLLAPPLCGPRFVSLSSTSWDHAGAPAPRRPPQVRRT